MFEMGLTYSTICVHLLLQILVFQNRSMFCARDFLAVPGFISGVKLIYSYLNLNFQLFESFSWCLLMYWPKISLRENYI